jgi:hypothetical protein
LFSDICFEAERDGGRKHRKIDIFAVVLVFVSAKRSRNKGNIIGRYPEYAKCTIERRRKENFTF